MKHLTDEREPVTTSDIDEAIRDAKAWLGGAVAVPADLVERLLAVVVYAYGDPDQDERGA